MTIANMSKEKIFNMQKIIKSVNTTPGYFKI